MDQMNNRQKINKYKRSILLLSCLVLLLAGCGGARGPFNPAGSQRNQTGLQPGKVGQISLFLNLKEEKGGDLNMIIQSIEILAEDNTWIPLIVTSIEVSTLSLPGGQMFLGRSFVAPGYYSRLRIRAACDKQVSEPVSHPMVTELEIRNLLYVAKGDSHSLFLSWDISASVAASGTSKPVLSLAPKLKNMLADVAYVACPDINTVYMICTDKNWVCDSLGVTGRPSYLISDPNAPTANLFTLMEKSKEIKKVGPASNRVEASYPLLTLSKGLHFAVSPDSQWAYIIDQKRGNILRLNLHSGSIDVRKRLGYEPSYILYLEKRGLLAVTLSLSQAVVLLDPQTLEQVRAISTGSKPGGLMVYRDNFLYITEGGGNSVMVYDLALNRVQKRIPVGLSPRRILAANNHIYVTNYRSHSLSLLKPGQLGVSKTTTLNGPPLELAYSPNNKWLYVGNEATKGIDIIDPVNNKITAHISLGAIPRGMVTLD